MRWWAKALVLRGIVDGLWKEKMGKRPEGVMNGSQVVEMRSALRYDIIFEISVPCLKYVLRFIIVQPSHLCFYPVMQDDVKMKTIDRRCSKSCILVRSWNGGRKRICTSDELHGKKKSYTPKGPTILTKFYFVLPRVRGTFHFSIN